MSRADRISPKQKEVLYSDFLNNFEQNPVTGFLARVTNIESVKQSIRNLILTGVNERPYQPFIGSKIRTLLFDPIDSITEETLRITIEETVRQEPRAILSHIKVEGDPLLNGYTVSIIFSMINIPEQISLNVILRRVR